MPTPLQDLKAFDITGLLKTAGVFRRLTSLRQREREAAAVVCERWLELLRVGLLRHKQPSIDFGWYQSWEGGVFLEPENSRSEVQAVVSSLHAHLNASFAGTSRRKPCSCRLRPCRCGNAIFRLHEALEGGSGGAVLRWSWVADEVVAATRSFVDSLKVFQGWREGAAEFRAEREGFEGKSANLAWRIPLFGVLWSAAGAAALASLPPEPTADARTVEWQRRLRAMAFARMVRQTAEQLVTERAGACVAQAGRRAGEEGAPEAMERLVAGYLEELKRALSA